MTCNVPLDFAILVDTSGSISRKNFKLLLHFIRSLVNSFQVSEDHTHIAIIEYSTRASVQLRFNDLPGRKLTKNNVFDIVNKLPHTRGYTFIDRALRLVNEEVFTLKGGMRDDVRKVRWFPCEIIEINKSGIPGLCSRTSINLVPGVSHLAVPCPEDGKMRDPGNQVDLLQGRLQEVVAPTILSQYFPTMAYGNC